MKTIMKVLPLLAMLAGLSACEKRRPPRESWNDASVDVLIRNLSDPDPTARRNAAGALGGLKERAEKALPALELARDDEDWTVRQEVEMAVSKILRALDRRAAAASAALVARSAP